MSEGLKYSVKDRSLLLPFYKRFFVEPVLGLLPRSLDPNAITHAGHLVNLLGLLIVFFAFATGAKMGWPYAAAALCLHFYNWCDNADGAHARRVGRTSATGELLDHGLDALNVTYIACLSAIGVGAPPLAWIAMVLLITFACAATYWEQAETGVFHLGSLNQVESVFVLGAVLATSAAFGSDVFDRLRLGPVTLRSAIVLFTCATSAFGIVRNMVRVASAHGAGSLGPILGLVAIDVMAFVAAWLGAITPSSAVVIATGANVFFGIRCLTRRTVKERPRSEPVVTLVVVALGMLLASGLASNGVAPFVDVAAAVVSSIVFGVLALANARAAFRAVSELDREAAASPVASNAET